MTRTNSKTSFTITLDDDALVPKMIEGITGLKTEHYPSQKAFLERPDGGDEPSSIFVDIHLGIGDNGLDVIPAIRARWPFCPILVVTGDTSDAAIGQALAAGANDFVRKPINKAELTARLGARLAELSRRANVEVIEAGDLKYDVAHKLVEGPSGRRHLSPTEALLLECLLEAKGMVVPKPDLKRRVWGSVTVSDNAVDKKIHGLRTAIRDLTESVTIVAKYGEGIALMVEPKMSKAS